MTGAVTAGAGTPPERWEALDVVRGMTVAGMLLVNNPGTWSAMYPPLAHAPWHGWTPTDLIFPFFLFIVGITTAWSLGRRAEQGADDGAIRRQIVRRGLLIFLFGLLLAAFPFYPITRLTGLRIPGVLQRIGVCYLAGGLLAWRRSNRAVAGIAAALLLGYWAAMTLVPPPGQAAATLDVPDQTLAAWLDRLLLGGHLWASSKTWDPEGPLSTIPAIGTVLLGVLAGRWLRTPRPMAERLNGLFAAGTAGLIVGSVWGWVFPINKNLWTSSYVIFTAGAAAVLLGLVSWLMDTRGRHGAVVRFFAVYGRNPLVAFLGSGLMAKAMASLIKVPFGGESVPLQQAVYRTLFAPWLRPVNASLAYALAFVGFWYLVLALFSRRGWIIKV
ncbi:MAG: acyltransferase family protein [Gemmatimonadales bacterium]